MKSEEFIEVQDEKAYKVCSKVDSYIERIIKELNMPPLIVKNRLITHDQLNAKLKDYHWKRTTKLNNLEWMIHGMLEQFLVDPIMDTTRLQESMVYMKYMID